MNSPVSKHDQQLHRYCHGIENQLSFALNRESMEGVLLEHPGATVAEQAAFITLAIRTKGPLVA